MKAALLLLAMTALAGCVTVHQPARSIAITIDDLPLHGPLPSGQSAKQVSDQLVAALRQGRAMTATGFVNGHWTESQPETLRVLEDWRDAGLLLANHGWAHRNFGDITLAEVRAEIDRNEPLLERLQPGQNWRWLRYPFLSEGTDPKHREAVRRYLAQRTYRVAAVTMDFSDWQFTAPYARCRARNDEAAVARLEQLYLTAASKSITYSRELSRRLYGRDIPYVLLAHGGAFTARIMPRLLALYRAEGFRFVSLADAQRDLAYATSINLMRSGPPATLEGAAQARNVPLPTRPSYASTLESICT
jgi:peptidoglycan/xylan/chitin deacetylase (PgdA/CDA1 family)